MSERAGVSERYRTASPWPLFVAFGFALSEIGLFLGLFPVAVGGVLLFGGSVAGILTESAYVDHLWKTTTYVGIALVVVGTGLVALGGSFGTEFALVAIEEPNVSGHRLPSRGLAIGVAGFTLIGTGIAGQLGQHPTR